ncbi:MAG TPA: divalent-cation tolerance protein CutA [Chromatiaceae bacterium]|nr:divalent-cation tolerance protein CutA [Chromatiaceae bacterium]
MIVVLSTCPQERAKEIAEALVEKGVAACVNVTPSIQSVYRWQGKLQWDEEALLVIKSNRNAWTSLERALRQLHPYEVPEIVALPVEQVSNNYLNWVEGNLCTD